MSLPPNLKSASRAVPQASPDKSTGERSPRFELVVLLVGIFAFFLINLATAEKTPTVWSDEVMYQDPAVNLFQGNGFHSGAWFAQDIHRFWASNVPLYQFVLFGWLKLFGFSLLSVRAMSYLLISVAVLLAWLAVRRFRLIASPGLRLLFCVMLCLGNASVFVYRLARPDSLGMFCVALAFVAFSFRTRWASLILIGCCGVLLTWTGLQLAVYAGLLSGLLMLWAGREYRLRLAVLCAGCALGGALLVVFYRHFGAWDDFVRSIRPYTLTTQLTNADHVVTYRNGLGDKLRRLPRLYMDYSYLPLLAVSLGMAWLLRRKNALHWKSPFVFGFTASLLTPAVLQAIAVFPDYYFWMSFIPLALGVCAGIPAVLPAPRLFQIAFFCMVGLTCMAGLPRRLAVASTEWQARSYAPVMELAAPFVSRDELVFSEFAGYYAAKQNSSMVVLYTCLPLLNEKDKSRISVAIVAPGHASEVIHEIGGEWREAKSFQPMNGTRRFLNLRENLDSRQYNLKVLVRVKASP